MVKLNVVDHGEVTLRLLLASGQGIVRVMKSVCGSHLAQPRCRLGFAHAIMHGQTTTSNILLNIKQILITHPSKD